MKVSIICPTYNSQKYILRLLENLNKQVYLNFELILVDDYSTDNTIEIIHKFINQNKSRFPIKLVQNEANIGAGLTRNKGVEIADGDYIGFIDVDDLWNPNKLYNQIKFMEENDYEFTYTHFYNYYENSNKISKISISPKKLTYRKLLFFNPIRTSSVIYSSKTLGKIYFPEIRKRQDYGLWLDLTKKCKCGRLLDQYLVYYTISDNSLSRTSKLGLVKFHWELFRKYQFRSKVGSFISVVSNTLINGIFFKIVQLFSKKTDLKEKI